MALSIMDDKANKIRKGSEEIFKERSSEMKKLFIILAIVLGVIFIVGTGTAFADRDRDSPAALKADEEKEPEGAKCPVTTITDQTMCYDCHELQKIYSDADSPGFNPESNVFSWKWGIKPQKAKDPKRLFRKPLWIKLVNNEPEGYFEFDGKVSLGAFGNFCDYMNQIPKIKEVTIDIFSGGGGLFDGVAIANKIFGMQQKGIVVTTKIHAFAASAALVVFVASDIRLVNNYSMLMWHELWTFEFWPKIVTPSSKEDEAKVLRFLQDNMNRYISDRTGREKKEVDEIVHRMEWWMTGKDAVELGIATGYIE